MSIASRIKEELFYVEMAYYETLDAFKKKRPYGVNFCYDTIKSEAATDAMRLSEREAALNALLPLVSQKLPNDIHESMARNCFTRYREAMTAKEMDAVMADYNKLYTIKS